MICLISPLVAPSDSSMEWLREAESPLLHSKCTQNAEASEPSPTLSARQSKPEESIRLQGPPHMGAWRGYKAGTKDSPVAGILPNMGCPALLLGLLLFPVVTPHEAGTTVDAPGPFCSCLVPGLKGKVWVFPHSPPATVGKLNMQSRQTELFRLLTEMLLGWSLNAPS